MIPSDADLKKFWEWCGWRKDCGMWYSPVKDSLGRGHGRISLPDLDLNNVFQYAVPKLEHPDLCSNPLDKRWHFTVGTKANWFDATEGDPALALFWAVMEIVNDADRLSQKKINPP